MNKYMSSESDNYYIPFLDLMSGVVFILMLILSSEIINIKYGESFSANQTPISEQQDKVEYFKRKIITNIANYLNKNNIKTYISNDFNSLVINGNSLFDKNKVSLSVKGQDIAKKISEAFNNNLLYLMNSENGEKKKLDYIKSIAINVYPSSSKDLEDIMISKSLIFYGYLIALNKNILSFSNNYTPKLFMIDDKFTLQKSLIHKLQGKNKDFIILRFEFTYPSEPKKVW